MIYYGLGTYAIKWDALFTGVYLSVTQIPYSAIITGNKKGRGGTGRGGKRRNQFYCPVVRGSTLNTSKDSCLLGHPNIYGEGTTLFRNVGNHSIHSDVTEDQGHQKHYSENLKFRRNVSSFCTAIFSLDTNWVI
jgi:hypothetical protein